MNAHRFFRSTAGLMALGLLAGCAVGPRDYKPGPEGVALARDDVYARCRSAADAVPAPPLALQDPFLGSNRDDYLDHCMQQAGYYPARLSLFP